MLELGFQVEAVAPTPSVEEEMLTLVNQERAALGLRPLAMDPALRDVARAHAVDMFRRGYFSHVTPEGLTPAGRLRQHNIRRLITGENLALAPTVAVAHRGLMNSPGHRRNILLPAYRRAGIGVIDGGIHGSIFVQQFSD